MKCLGSPSPPSSCEQTDYSTNIVNESVELALLGGASQRSHRGLAALDHIGHLQAAHKAGRRVRKTAAYNVLAFFKNSATVHQKRSSGSYAVKAVHPKALIPRVHISTRCSNLAIMFPPRMQRVAVEVE